MNKYIYMLQVNTVSLNFFFQFLVYKTRYEALQKDTTVAHDRNQQSEIRELLIMFFYFD